MKLTPKRKAALADILNDYILTVGDDPRRKDKIMLATMVAQQLELESKATTLKVPRSKRMPVEDGCE